MLIRAAAPDEWPIIWRMMEPIMRAGETLALPRDGTEEHGQAYWSSPEKVTVWQLSRCVEGDEVPGLELHPAEPAGRGHPHRQLRLSHRRSGARQGGGAGALRPLPRLLPNTARGSRRSSSTSLSRATSRRSISGTISASTCWRACQKPSTTRGSGSSMRW